MIWKHKKRRPTRAGSPRGTFRSFGMRKKPKQSTPRPISPRNRRAHSLIRSCRQAYFTCEKNRFNTMTAEQHSPHRIYMAFSVRRRVFVSILPILPES